MGDKEKILIERTEETDKLWNTFLDKEQVRRSLGRIYYEGWLSQEMYIQGIQYIEERNIKQDRDIMSMGLPTKAYRCLKNSKVCTTRQLWYILTGNLHPQSSKDFFDIRNIGLKGGLEVMQIAIDQGVIKKEEIGINCGKRNNAKWTACRDFFGLPAKK